MKLLLITIIAYLAFHNNSRAQIITTVAGGVTGHGSYWGDNGPATSAAIGYTAGIAVDKNGDLFIADANNNRVRKVVAATGIISCIAGTGIAGYNGDDIAANTAQLNNPEWICVDTFGNIFITDAGNYRVRKIEASTGIIKTVAGNGSSGYNGDNILATNAKLNGVQGVAVDKIGNLYLNDGNNYRVRKIDTSGIILTIAGTGISNNTGDEGPATNATITGMLGICLDTFGNVYTTDDAASIRMINTNTGIISRVAGTGDHISMPYLGDGMQALSSHISSFGVAVDMEGYIYISDFDNSRIEIIDHSGFIYTIAGIGVSGFSGDSDLATSAEISMPENVVLDPCGNVYIADFNNKRIRKVTLPHCGYLVVSNIDSDKKISTFPNPASKTITITAPVLISNISISNILGRQLYTHNYSTSKAEIDVSNLPQGVYTVRVNNTYVQKLVKE